MVVTFAKSVLRNVVDKRPVGVEAVRGSGGGAANFECVTTKDGVKFVHAWLQFRAKYKTGEVVDNTCFLDLRVAEHNRFASEVCIYDTASLPKGSPYSEGEEGK